MSREELQADAVAEATRFGLRPDLVCAIIEVESKWNPSLYRFEPNFLKRYVPLNLVPDPHITLETERVARAISWGPMQIMGQTARDLGYKQPSFIPLCDGPVGIMWGCKFLATRKAKFIDEWGWEGVVAAYNAGSPVKYPNGRFRNDGYVRKVFERAEKYSNVS